MNIDNQEQYEFDDYLDEIGQFDFNSVSITGTDWTTETIIRQVEKGNISLSPVFQRRDAWTPERKSLFIESLLIGMPIPQLVLAEDPKQRGRYIVLDGKQRLLSILQFAAVNSRDKYPALRLRHLPLLSDIEGMTYEELESSGYNLSIFENQWIRTVIIKNSPSENMLAQVFYRLNTGSLPLSPQELRFALHPGDFTKYIDEKSESSAALKFFLGNTSVDFRMRDVELMLRIFANHSNISSYNGNLKYYLDNCFEQLSTHFTEKKTELDILCSEVEKAHDLVYQIFGNDSYKKWNGTLFEGRKNRAIFEILIHTLSNEKTRDTITNNKDKSFKEMFLALCSQNRNFINSIEKTTKSITAVSNRFNLLIDEINKLYKTDLVKITFRKV